MIAVVSTGSYVGGALKYNLDKVRAGEAEIIGSSRCVCSSFDEVGKNITAYQINQTFAPYLEANQRTKNVVFSCSLNPHPNEAKSIDDDTFYRMAKDYMDGMGYANQPYVVIKHEDIDRPHIHIVSLRVDADGKKISDSMEHARSNRVRQEIEQKYGLMTTNESSLSETREAKAERAVRFIERNKLNGNEKEDRKKIKSILMYVQDYYKPKDMSEFNKLLRQFFLSCKEIKEAGENEREVRGCQFVRIDANYNVVGTAYKGSLFGKQNSIEGLNAYFEKSKQYDKERVCVKQDIKSRIDDALAKPETKSIYDLSANLHKSGIKMDLHSNAEGRLTGISFIDNVAGHTLKGSELGKSYSLNAIQKKVAAEKQPMAQTDDMTAIIRNPRQGETDVKRKIEEVLKEVQAVYKPQNMDEYNDILSNYDVRCIRVEGKNKDGKAFKGCKYSLVDDKGNAVGHALSGSMFGKEYSLYGLEKRFSKESKLARAEQKEIFTALRKEYLKERKLMFFESDLLEKLPSMKDRLLEIAKQVKPIAKQNLLDNAVQTFISLLTDKKQGVEVKEREYVKSQMQCYIRFASVLPVEKRQSFLEMVDVKTENGKFGIRFSHTKKENYSFSWSEVARPIDGEKIALNPIVPIAIKDGGDARVRLNKKDKEVVKAFVTGDWSKVELSDRRFNMYTLKSVLGEKELSELQYRQNEAQSKSLMAKFYNLSTEKMMGELLTRGLVIVPASKASGERTYMVGNSQNPTSTFVELPSDVVKDLNRIGYATSIYPNVKSFVYDKNGMPSKKHLVSASIATARDYSDGKMVERIIKRVEKINPDLANKMNSFNGKLVDYDGMIKAVLLYSGEKFEKTNVSFIDAIRSNDIEAIKKSMGKGNRRKC